VLNVEFWYNRLSVVVVVVVVELFGMLVAFVVLFVAKLDVTGNEYVVDVVVVFEANCIFETFADLKMFLQLVKRLLWVDAKISESNMEVVDELVLSTNVGGSLL
jgi:hypothetical protein